VWGVDIEFPTRSRGCAVAGRRFFGETQGPRPLRFCVAKYLSRSVGLMTSALVAAGPLACSSSDISNSRFTGGSGGSTSGAGGDSSGAGGGPHGGGTNSGGGNLIGVPLDGSVDFDATTEDCSEAAKLVYVISEDNNTLYSFAPDKLTFTMIGPLDCEPRGRVNSMAVARDSTAYVNYADGKIFRVNTQTRACTDTGFVPGQSGFSPNLSMGFSTNAPGSKEETLFVSDNTGDDTQDPVGKGLAKIDLSSMTLTPLGVYTDAVAGGRCELTGTGDARLFGFFTTIPAHLAEIDKMTGATPNAVELPGVDASTGGYAFSFWGGDFWFYTAKEPAPSSSVTHYVTATKTSTVALTNIGFTIVGAGVSTCAPLVFPPPA
jgi:hypothetical protein